jgi:hypothetical protein
LGERRSERLRTSHLSPFFSTRRKWMSGIVHTWKLFIREWSISLAIFVPVLLKFFTLPYL